MTIADSQSLQRTAQYLAVEILPAHGSPPEYSGDWLPVWGAAIEQIVIERDSRASSATIWFPATHWDSPTIPNWADMVRIRTVEQDPAQRTFLYVGFVVAREMSFCGGDDKRPGHEQVGIRCLDFRWMLATTSPIIGQHGRSIDDIAIGTDSATWFDGRRAIFNPASVPNKDRDELEVYADDGITLLYKYPIFCNPSKDKEKAAAWTARDMVRYLLVGKHNKAKGYFGFTDPSDLIGLRHTDFDKVLNHIVVDTLNVAEALECICR